MWAVSAEQSYFRPSDLENRTSKTSLFVTLQTIFFCLTKNKVFQFDLSLPLDEQPRQATNQQLGLHGVTPLYIGHRKSKTHLSVPAMQGELRHQRDSRKVSVAFYPYDREQSGAPWLSDNSKLKFIY
eukprot:sb/3475456/